MSTPTATTLQRFDVLLKGGRVIDPAAGRDGLFDVAITADKIAAVEPSIPASAARTVVDVSGKLVLPGLIDTHGHCYEHVTGSFGLNADQVGVRSGVTTVVDQGGASPLTFPGFRKFIVEQSKTRVLSFVSIYLAGGLLGHRYEGLYGPGQINVDAVIRAIEENRDLIKGIKAHAEVGGYSRHQLDVLALAKQASRATGVPVYVHLGRLWPEADGIDVDVPEMVREVVPMLDEGDVLAHPFTRHPGGFVSDDGVVHPVLLEAAKRGARIDVGRGSHFSIEAARIAAAAGVVPYTLGADLHGYTLRNGAHASLYEGVFKAENDKGLMTGTMAGDARPDRVAVFDLAQAMTEMLGLGYDLKTVVASVTSNAAELLGMTGEIGTLKTGVTADVSVLALEEGSFTLKDGKGVAWNTDKRLRMLQVWRAGVEHAIDSPLLSEFWRAAA